MKENLLKKYGLGSELKRQEGLRATAMECKEQGTEVICTICAAKAYCNKVRGGSQ